MRLDARFVGWGIFLIIAGAIPAAVQAGALDPGVLAGAWRLWPLFLVAAGLGFLLRATPFASVGGLLAAALGGLFVGGLLAGLAGADFGAMTCGPGASGTAFPTASGTLAPGGSVHAELDCGELSIATAAGDGWTLEGTSRDGKAPVVSSNGAALSVTPNRPPGTGPFFTPPAQGWTLTVPTSTARYDVTLNAGSANLALGSSGVGELAGNVNAGTLRADLANTTVRRLDVTVNAGSARLVLPDATIDGSLTVNAGSISFCAPASVGLRLEAKDGLGSNNYAAIGLTKSGDTWTSANWSSAVNRIDLDTTANAGSFTLNPKDGCR